MGKTIGIGISGGIAAYKIADLVSRLRKEGWNVVVLMTEAAMNFVAPLTFQTLSNNNVYTDLWQDTEKGKVQHISIAESLDLMVIAPATANIIAKIAHGIADDLLSTVVLANTAPLLVFPAMNTHMYQNPSVQKNIKQLKEFGYQVFEPASGKLACGDEGPGRLLETDEILRIIKKSLLLKPQDLAGKKLMINAGTTCEDIDPVRYITNRGTGRMGYALAEEALERGAEVILVSGPSHLDPPYGCEFVSVWGVDDMCQAMLDKQEQVDAIIGAAAVGDFRMAEVCEQKMKKEGAAEVFPLDLVVTTDILKTLSQHKKKQQVIVGFAAETENVIENARKKMAHKDLDMIVANDVTEEGAGFAVDTNIVTLITKEDARSYPLMSKKEVAGVILDKVSVLLCDT